MPRSLPVDTLTFTFELQMSGTAIHLSRSGPAEKLAFTFQVGSGDRQADGGAADVGGPQSVAETVTGGSEREVTVFAHRDGHDGSTAGRVLHLRTRQTALRYCSGDAWTGISKQTRDARCVV